MSQIFVGRIVKAFGIRGELKFHPSDDFWEELLHSQNLALELTSNGKSVKNSIVFKSVRPHGNSYVIQLDGVSDRTTAESYVGGEISISSEEIDVDMPDRLLPFQIVGANVATEEGIALGEVTAVIFSSAHDVYEVTNENGKQVLIPAVPEFVTSLDKEHRKVVVRTIPGLIDE